jgi:hypothetical protein
LTAASSALADDGDAIKYSIALRGGGGGGNHLKDKHNKDRQL